MSSDSNTRSTIKFRVNGVEHTVGEEMASDIMLVDYIREHLELRGTKFMCREAGCGACLIAVRMTPDGPIVSVNSCVIPVMSCNGWTITTVEEVGNKLNGYHPVQKTIACKNGTQCGYCTPGWVMAMYSLLQSGKEMTMLEIEKAFGSNICRCTGYRSLLEALKKFAIDSPSRVTDIEDMHICKQNENGCCKQNCLDKDWCVVSDEDVTNSMVKFSLKDGRNWYIAYTIQDIFKVFVLEGKDSYMLAAGNTSKVPYPSVVLPQTIIDVCGVSELKGYSLDQNLIIGAGSSLTEFMDILDVVSETDGFSYLKTINEHMEYVGHIPVRNLGTIAGNLMIKHQNNGFASDVFLLLNTVGADLTIESMYGKETVSMEKFIETDMKGKVIVSVILAPLSDEYLLATYKIMSRYQAVHAIVNCGFCYKLDSENVVLQARIVFSSLNTEVGRATETEAYLVGKALFTNETLQSALKVLEAELVVEDSPPEPSAEFRKGLALKLFYKGLLSLCPTETIHPKYLSGATKIHDELPVSEGTQTYETDSSLWPLNQPMPKIEALIQCSGEAVYSGDIPKIPREVFISLVLATVPYGDIVSIDPTEALALEGVLKFYSAKDITGRNAYTPNDTMLYNLEEELFCSGTVKYFNQAIGVIVAESQQIADVAAKLVTATYKNVKDPVYDIKVAKTDESRVTSYMTIDATDKGTDIEKVITGTNVLYGQYHFPMETVVCVVKPTEEGLEVHTATQWINGVQLMISRALNLDESKIDVYCRRVGGSYGFKISRSSQAAVACSLVSHLMNRPCRIMQSLSTNMKVLGKRLPFCCDYEVGVNSSGVIQYNNMNHYEDNGYCINEDFYGLSYDAINNCYDSSRWTTKCYNVVTDTAKNTWCRAPGTLEFIANTEMIMDRISYELSLDPVDVRVANLNTTEYEAVQEVYETLKSNANYDTRRKEVDEFNAANRWKKRGLRFSFLRWTPVTGGIMEVLLSVYHGDGTVTITHGGIEMGQGINTKVIQVCSYLLKIPCDKIQVKSSNSNSTPNMFISGGSLTSENVCICVYKCCEEILGRLATVKETLLKDSSTEPTWEELVATAFANNVDLHTRGVYTAAENVTYDVYGACLTEVEIDVLTGQLVVRQVDLIEDLGQSVSPEIDIGQVEGAFVMGLGYWTCEHLVYDPSTGEPLTNRAWTYPVPQARDIPNKFNVWFRNKSYSNAAVFGSKCSGEPPICMAVSIFLAAMEAIMAARKDNGITEYYAMTGPMSVEAVGTGVLTTTDQLKFY